LRLDGKDGLVALVMKLKLNAKDKGKMGVNRTVSSLYIGHCGITGWECYIDTPDGCIHVSAWIEINFMWSDQVSNLAEIKLVRHDRSVSLGVHPSQLPLKTMSA